MLVVTRETLSIFSASAVDDEVKDERSIIQVIVQSNLPPSEKNLMRVFDDVSTVSYWGCLRDNCCRYAFNPVLRVQQPCNP